MQNEITTSLPLLNPDGTLAQKGYARRLLPIYNRKSIGVPWYRIKEWDYYCILNSEFGIALTVADNGYMGLYAANFFDFKKCVEIPFVAIEAFTKGKLNMPLSSETGNTIVNHKKAKIKFTKYNDKRILNFDFPQFDKQNSLKGELVLRELNQDSMAIVTPFKENKHAFYFNQKINNLAAEGSFNYGGKEFVFKKEDSFGVLDWGRGVWTYKNRWYWGSASGMVEGNPFGFNIGYGFGDTSAATENMLFYNGIGHKLDEIRFHIDTNNYMLPWKFTSNDGRFEMDFEPAIDRYSNTNLILLKSIQHQVFGFFTGKAVLDNGKVLQVNRLLGFAEDVLNYW